MMMVTAVLIGIFVLVSLAVTLVFLGFRTYIEFLQCGDDDSDPPQLDGKNEYDPVWKA
ncbi:MAG: hypothetical protein IRZ03_18070 [Acidobacterium ailaaui]|jgi:hypothetical protein|nr:hypothetical protein [Pseudacidobacterium ailaaui]